MATSATTVDSSPDTTVEGMKTMLNLPQFWLGMGVLSVGAYIVPFENVISRTVFGLCILLYVITAYERNTE